MTIRHYKNIKTALVEKQQGYQPKFLKQNPIIATDSSIILSSSFNSMIVVSGNLYISGDTYCDGDSPGEDSELTGTEHFFVNQLLSVPGIVGNVSGGLVLSSSISTIALSSALCFPIDAGAGGNFAHIYSKDASLVLSSSHNSQIVVCGSLLVSRGGAPTLPSLLPNHKAMIYVKNAEAARGMYIESDTSGQADLILYDNAGDANYKMTQLLHANSKFVIRQLTDSFYASGSIVMSASNGFVYVNNTNDVIPLINSGAFNIYFKNLSGSYAGLPVIARFYNEGNNVDRKGISIACGTNSPSANGDIVWVVFNGGTVTTPAGVSSIQYSTASPFATFVATSDARMKKKIKLTKVDGLKIINNIQLCEFDWIDEKLPKQEIGYIAQQVEKVYPKMVGKIKKDNDNYLTVGDSDLIPVLVKAIQQQTEIIRKAENRVLKLEERHENK